jgi:hypothetical protein
VNIVLFGDFWQLKPVSGRCLFANPFEAPAGLAQHGQRLLWEAVRRLWELTECKRCEDSWYNAFLLQCRYGTMSMDMYYWMHGCPTSFSSSVEPSEVATVEGSSRVDLRKAYEPTWVASFLRQGATGSELMDTESNLDKDKRSSRNRVIREELKQNLNVASGDFVEAPAIYCFNVPRYWTILLRAREYAKKKEFQLSWCVARDVPLCRHDRDLDEEQLHTKRCIWLGRHDQDTAHLTSLLPLVQGLPLRLTETVNRNLRLYRGRREVVDFSVGHHTPKMCAPKWMVNGFPPSCLCACIFTSQERRGSCMTTWKRVCIHLCQPHAPGK